MSERIELPRKHQPSKEELLRAAAAKPVRRVFTVDVHGFHEEGAVFDGYPDFELRNSDLRMRASFADGITRGEMLFCLRSLLETVRDQYGWDDLTFMLRPDHELDAPLGGPDEDGTG